MLKPSQWLKESEVVIAAAYLDAAALVAADLIDEADHLSPVAAVITDVWVVEEDLD